VRFVVDLNSTAQVVHLISIAQVVRFLVHLVSSAQVVGFVVYLFSKAQVVGFGFHIVCLPWARIARFRGLEFAVGSAKRIPFEQHRSC